MDTVGPDFIHTLVEAKKLAYADRDAWYGDTDFVDVPLATLLSDAYNAERRKLITAQASRDLRPGSPDGRVPQPAPRSPAPSRRRPASASRPGRTGIDDRSGGAVGLAAGRAARGPADGDTCHLDVIDRHGNMVAATPSGGWLSVLAGHSGARLQPGTRGQMFWLEEGLPSSLAPGRRPRTTLTPSMALQGRQAPYIAFGTPGGDQQDQWSPQFFLHHVHHGMNLQAAIDAPAQSDTCRTRSIRARPSRRR